MDRATEVCPNRPQPPAPVTAETLARRREWFLRALISQGYENREPHISKILSRWLAKIWSSTAADPIKGLLLYGGPGAGKTFAARALAKFIPVTWRKAVDAARLYRSSIDTAAWKYDIAPMTCVINGRQISTLIIDDLGAETTIKHFGETHEPFSEIIEELWSMYERNPRLALIITTNLQLDPPKNKPNTPNILDRYGDRAQSRLLGMCWPIPVKLSDQRTTPVIPACPTANRESPAA